MAVISIDAHQSSLLALFARASEGRLKAGDLKKKLKPKSAEGQDASEADRALAGLIEQGLLAIAGGSKEGHHPRPNATYRLTAEGKQHLRPARPQISNQLLQYQEAFILLQVFRAREHTLSRSELNSKLTTRAATGQLEFDIKGSPETVSYHLAMLVEKGCLEEQRRGISVRYVLDPEKGMAALASAKQHDAVSFTMTGEILNSLLKVAGGVAAAPTGEGPG